MKKLVALLLAVVLVLGLMTGALAAAGFNADLPAQPQTAVNTICALLGWVPMLVAAVMLVVVCFHPIEKEMTAMERGKEA